MLTEDEKIHAFVGHVLVDKHTFIAMNTAAQKWNKIPVLKFCNQNYYILELF